MQRTVHTLIGKSGSGKTTLLRAMIGESSRALVFDCLSNFQNGVVSNSQETIKQYLLSRDCQKNREAKFRIIYRPNIDIAKRDHLSDSANWLCMVARAVGYCDLFFDELDTFADASEMPEQLDLLVRFGRNIGVSMHAAVRRPKVVIPRHWISETTRFSIFRITDPLDSSFLEDCTGIDRTRFNGLLPLHYISADEGIISENIAELA
jgi:hypothetical protein